MSGVDLQSLKSPVHGAKIRFHSIDLIRGLAAASILVFHFKNFAAGGGSLSRLPQALDGVSLLQGMSAIRNYGSWAVMLFWMLSGFVFMNVYGSRRPGWWQFWVNRIARLYPLHLLTLLVILALQVLAIRQFGHWLIFPADSALEFAKQLFFASAWLGDQHHSFNGPIWSVSVEVLIYLCFYFYAQRAPNNLATCLLAMVGFAALVPVTHGSNLAVCGLFFFGGASGYALFTLCPPEKRRHLAAASAALFVAFTIAGLRFGTHGPLSLWLLPIFGTLVLTLACAEEAGLRRVFQHTGFVGDMSYSTYLWHSPLQMLFLLGAGFGLWSVDAAFSNAFFVAYLITVCGVAWLSFRFIEQPAQAWVRETFLHSRRDVSLITAP